MKTEEIKLVKKTWRTLMNIDPEIIGDAFYSKLFSEHPQLRKLFPKEMKAQYVKLIDMLTSIVTKLDRLDQYAEEIKAMALRHVGYGVKPSHYFMVGAALIWTLKTALKEDWTPEVESAWLSCYNTLSDAMIEVHS